MKHLSKTLLLFCLVALGMSSCKKDENKVVFEDGTAPVATSSLTGSVTLNKQAPTTPLVTFTWTNPNYQLNTGVSSQDVQYAVQIDTVGGTGFKTFSTAKIDLSKGFTHGDLNTFLIKSRGDGGLGLEPLVEHQLRIRVKSFLGSETDGNATNLYSNEMKFNVTPYSEDPDLWITGDALPSGWTNTPPDVTQKFSYTRSDNTFTLETNLPATGTLEGYKFLTIKGSWQPQWGGATMTGGVLSVNPGGGSDPAAIKAPAVAGLYRLSVNWTSKTLTVTKL